MDDEPAVLRLVEMALAARGYEVHALASPMMALQLAKDSPSFDLIVSDVIMPEICGPELVRRLMAFSPETAVILMSAHIAAEALPRGVAFISKPFRVADLYAVVDLKCPAPAVED